MQISITTMKYRNKNYISMGTFWLFLIPIIGFTIVLPYCLSDTFHAKSPGQYAAPKAELDTPEYNLPLDTPEFQMGDEALFNFTGDTVLVLNQPETLDELNGEVRVLHKTPQGGFETIDLPDNWLVKIPTDTLPAKKPVPLNDKLEQYKKAMAK